MGNSIPVVITECNAMAAVDYYLCILIVMAALAKTEAQSVEPADVTVFQGQQVTFNCSGSVVSWNYAKKLSLPAAKIFSSPNTWHRGQGNKYDIIGQYYLVVNDVQADSDAGVYQCNTNENNNILQATLVVIDEISMSVDPPGQLMRGMTITISCEVRYQGRETLSSEQDPDLTLTFANEQDLPTGITYYHQPSSDGAFQRKTLEVNYTVTEATPTGKLRCTVTSMAYQGTAEETLQINFPPKINRIELTETAYNTSDTITCSAEGLPTPTVAWTHISGSMPANRQFTGQGKAVLKNLKSGDHKWMCTASSAEGSDNYTLTFNVQDLSSGGSTGGGDRIVPGLAVIALLAVSIRLLITLQ